MEEKKMGMELDDEALEQAAGGLTMIIMADAIPKPTDPKPGINELEANTTRKLPV